jgi:tRNA (guanine37-N1)-methyltransferase
VVVADAMAGVGPFAVPLTSSGTTKHQRKHGNSNTVTTTVYANDLNPTSYKYLKINSQHNKCRNLHCYNMDARAFLRHLQDKQIEFHHVIMNLPATASEFLDAFRGFTNTILPTIHVHCFAPKELEIEDKNITPEQEAINQCSKHLGCQLDSTTVKIHVVRDVSPNKNMLCVSFPLPEAVRSIPRIRLQDANDDDQQPGAKRLRTDK